jgi:hypothetical protein
MKSSARFRLPVGRGQVPRTQRLAALEARSRSPARSRKGEYKAGFEAAGFDEVTHQVLDGMHGAIVKAVKTREPARSGLPVVQPAVHQPERAADTWRCS